MHNIYTAPPDTLLTASKENDITFTFLHNAAKSASLRAPPRRKRPVQSTARQRRNNTPPSYASNNQYSSAQDNEYIATGYRGQLTYWGTVKSLFRLHNETGNIWTHLLGGQQSQMTGAQRVADLSKPVIHHQYACLDICRIYAVPGADMCHCLHPARAAGKGITPAPGSQEPAV